MTNLSDPYERIRVYAGFIDSVERRFESDEERRRAVHQCAKHIAWLQERWHYKLPTAGS